ncbi:MAG TPA: DUF4365 domain-containing protein [Longimicrobium sp.]|nr:DUF4365 domain-containing protein [Longimicrobium sp.]
MRTPFVPATLWTERAGILAVASEVNRLGLIWREQQSVDIGIDGQIELVDAEGRATGRVVAVQVKSGRSYFKDDRDCWIHDPGEKHRLYWEIFPLPVLLMLHSPEDRATYWVDARQELRAAQGAGAIRIPKTNLLQRATAADLFQTAGIAAHTFLDLPSVLHALCSTRLTSATFPLSYFDLFANGLTNIANAVYFAMDLVMEIADANLPDEEEWISFGSETHEFLFGFLQFLVEQNLADVDVSSALVDWNTRRLLPTLISPLTSRGRALVTLIGEMQGRYQAEGRLHEFGALGVAQEDFVRMAFTPSHYDRLPLISAFQELVRASRPTGTL